METTTRPTKHQLATEAIAAFLGQQLDEGPLHGRTMRDLHDETDPNMFFVEAAERLGWDFDLHDDADEQLMNDAMVEFDRRLSTRGWLVIFGADFDVPYDITSHMVDLSDRSDAPFAGMKAPTFGRSLGPGASVLVAVDHPLKDCRRGVADGGKRFLVSIQANGAETWHETLPQAWVGQARYFGTDDPEEAMALVRMAQLYRRASN